MGINWIGPPPIEICRAIALSRAKRRIAAMIDAGETLDENRRAEIIREEMDRERRAVRDQYFVKAAPYLRRQDALQSKFINVAFIALAVFVALKLLLW